MRKMIMQIPFQLPTEKQRLLLLLEILDESRLEGMVLTGP
ncbi:hypothetical protein SAMN05421881_102041 [Nitrosomonas halophila]|uniref:Uncharacterized protein n=1 Tax=Nitrosomonas halophila TaxID=44576 RepID=A0A1H3HMU5_9PROT|nr:hypothetical protein SAMN05421881_102041 [Nitrosomonas halophila]